MATGVSREKRPLCEAEVSISKAARVETAFAKLPDEVLAMIASNLSDIDLKAFALSGEICLEPALRVRISRVFEALKAELGKLNDLTPPGPVPPHITPICTFQDVVRSHLMAAAPGAPIPNHLPLILPTDPQQAESLQQTLLSFVNEKLPEELSSFRSFLKDKIDHRALGWDDLDKYAQNFAEGLVARALIKIIEVSPNPEEAREAAVMAAVEYKHSFILKEILDQGDVSDIWRGSMVVEAAKTGNLDAIKILFENGFVSGDCIYKAITQAQEKGYKDIDEFLSNHMAWKDFLINRCSIL